MSNINICAQDAFLALHPQSKRPVDANWPDEGKSREQALAASGNLGLLLGPKSDVMDVDLDCKEAKALAERCVRIFPLRVHSKINRLSFNYMIKLRDINQRSNLFLIFIFLSD